MKDSHLHSNLSASRRTHGLRHTFATQTMIDTYRAGRDPARTLTLLAVWLGHANPADTYCLIALAIARDRRRDRSPG